MSMNTHEAITYFEEVAKYHHDIDDPSSQEIYDACGLALSALREQEARENPRPLTLDELKERVGRTVWYQSTIGGFCGWVIVEIWFPYQGAFSLSNGDVREKDYGKTWLAYDHKPEDI